MNMHDNKCMKSSAKFRELLKKGFVCGPSVYNPFTGRLAELAGFEACHFTGMGHEVTHIGMPDIGLQTMTEVANTCARIAAAVDIPIIADIDTGFGGLLNIRRTIREMERAGVAGIHIEDQKSPKRCPYLDGVKVLNRSEAIDRVKAVVDARVDPDFMIIARSDASIISFNELIDRCNLFIESGADMVMPIFINCDKKSYFILSPDEQMGLIKRINQAINGPVMSMGTPPPVGYTVNDMASAGYSFFIFAVETLTASANAIAGLYKCIKETGNVTSYMASHPGPYSDFMNIMRAVHLDECFEFENSHMSELQLK